MIDFTLLNPKHWGLDAATAAIVLGVVTYVWRQAQGFILGLPWRFIKLFMYTYTIRPAQGQAVYVGDYIDSLEKDPTTKFLVRPRDFMPISGASAFNKEHWRKLVRDGRDAQSNELECDAGSQLSVGFGIHWFYTKKYGIIRISIQPSDNQKPNGGLMSSDLLRYSGGYVERTVSVFGFGASARACLSRFIDDARDHYAGRVEDSRNCYVYAQGSWNPSIDLRRNPRSVDTVFTDDGSPLAVLSDVRAFLNSKEFYLRTGVPYHYGILLYGPPGTGKTTLAQAVAHDLDLRLYVLQFDSSLSDSMVSHALRTVPPRSIVLFEDIDCNTSVANARSLPKVTRRSPEGGLNESPALPEVGQSDSMFGATLSGLLNALDGVFAPSDVIYMFTTNNPEALDEGLLRTGRIDRKYHLGLIGKETQVRMLQHFGCPASVADQLDSWAAPCDVQEAALTWLKFNSGAHNDQA